MPLTLARYPSCAALICIAPCAGRAVFLWTEPFRGLAASYSHRSPAVGLSCRRSGGQLSSRQPGGPLDLCGFRDRCSPSPASGPASAVPAMNRWRAAQAPVVFYLMAGRYSVAVGRADAKIRAPMRRREVRGRKGKKGGPSPHPRGQGRRGALSRTATPTDKRTNGPNGITPRRLTWRPSFRLTSSAPLLYAPKRSPGDGQSQGRRLPGGPCRLGVGGCARLNFPNAVCILDYDYHACEHVNL